MCLKNVLPLAVCLFFSTFSFSQKRDSYLESQTTDNYDYKEAFAGSIYTNTGNQYRSASGKPGPDYWQNAVDYQIDVLLDEKLQTITGTELITYTNNSPDDLEFLWLQLDQNMFSPGSRASAIKPVQENDKDNGSNGADGGYKIRSVRLVENGKEFELNCTITDTRMQLLLPDALKAKGGRLTIKIEFAFTIPANGSGRMGILETTNGKIYSIAQWYPRLCVYDDINGWNTLPYTGASEFYLEYGDFQVNITAPDNHVVVCSGELLNPEDVYSSQQRELWAAASKSDKTILIRSEKDARNAIRSAGKTLTWKYKMENTRDVAWASSSAFLIDAARINLSGEKTALAVSAYPAESSGNLAWGRSTEYIKASLEHYSAKWVEYPYPAAINVASNAGGMEYPGIVFCSASSRTSALWSVTDHEFGHTIFPMIVGSNERLHPWMDEGLNMFINGISTISFNKGEYDKGPRNMKKWTSLIMGPSLEPVATSADNMKRSNLSYLAYYKPAIALDLLRKYVLGEERFDRALKLYIDRWAYKHPAPADFFHTIENVSGEDLNWFWRGWFLHNWQLDQAITGVNYIKNDPSHGILITVANLNKMVMPVVLEVKTKSGKVSRIQLPAEIWKRNASWTFKYPSVEDIATVTLDPDHAFPDSDTDNNVWNVKN